MATSTTVNDGRDPNVVDRASDSADKALEATRRAAGAAIDKVADKVHGIRDAVSPTVDRIVAPVDSVTRYTQESPIKSLLAAAALGAALMALVSLLGRSGR
jgi:ElaB/YqjD/DUF883 family membrane-anchored ribosome-binding protein